MINSQDVVRLANLYTSVPENEHQSILRDKMISELEFKLGIKQRESDAMAINGDIDDLGNDFKFKK